LSGIARILVAVQVSSGSVAGTVSDGESRAPLADAIVSLIDLDRNTLTGADGRYALADVPPGPQHVVVHRVGYASRTFHALVPRQGTLEINVVLPREPITIAPIEVRGAVPIRGLDDDQHAAFPNRGLSLAAVRNHPLLSEPDVLQATSGGEIVLRPEAPSGIHVRGGASDQIAYVLDGIPVLSPYHAAGTFSAWNPDALARLDVLTTSPPPQFPDALSGVVSATTRAPGAVLQSRGSLSTTQARATIDGPLGHAGAGYLASVRLPIPGLLFHRKEASHLEGDGVDWLGKVETPSFGGRAWLLGYGSDNTIESAAAEPDSAATSEADSVRNVLAWAGGSVGGGWTRQFGAASVTVRAWRAVASANATWGRQDSIPAERLDADRRDVGLVAMVEIAGHERKTTAGIRAERSRTSYLVEPVSGDGRSVSLGARTPVTAAFVQHERSVTARGEIDLSLTSAIAAGEVYVSPSAQLRYKPGGALVLSGAYARRHQFSQSVRNPESVVSTIFPVDLTVGSGAASDGGAGGVPVARSDLGVVALEHRPTAGIRLGVQAYAQRFDAIALVAPLDASPFAAGGFIEGSGAARGVALEAAANGARYGIIASYGLQRVRLEYADTTYVPEHGATHSIAAGVIVFPSPASSVRLGVESALGRRTTSVLGPFEWEACNLLDLGCEFAGSPRDRAGALGATRLPAYVRVDLGVRMHWHVQAFGREGLLALFGTATNLTGRRNVLTIAVDPATGQRTEIEMRPRAPLVVGIDWRF